MLDFLMISTRSNKRGTIEIYPKFLIKKTTDLMIRGGDFYAIWNEEKGLWSTDEQDALQLIDHELDIYAEQHKNSFDGSVRVLHMWDAESGMIDIWHKYCQRQMRDGFHMLDEKLIFSNDESKKKDYASKRLTYPLEPGDINAYDRLMSVLYSEDERKKIEWAIGSIVTGDSKKLQKFLVLYGSAGTGKSTVLNVIQMLFDGYYSVFDAKALGQSSNAFALEAFKTNPLVAIQHDGDLSKIEDNTRLNSLVSHELMTVNEKFRSAYSNRFKCFLFMGTNKPVKITDAKSGLLRRLIDVTPSGNKLPQREYNDIMKQIPFELGGIACHCRDVYLANKDAYDTYIPISMIGASNDFFNFIEDGYSLFSKESGVTLKVAWERYKAYCEDAKVSYPYSQRPFKEELKNYFREFKERAVLEDGTRVRNWYSGFRADKFEYHSVDISEKSVENDFIYTESIFDEYCSECFAQYASDKETPRMKWDNVTTTLKDIDTTKLHYVKIPENHIVIDFDIPDETGKKSFEKNLEAAKKFPPTYGELSKGGQGIHLHYIYNGDVSKLSRVYGDHIEVKIFTGNSSLRRKFSKCNNKPIATINSGLPLKGEKMVSKDVIKSEKGLRDMINRNLNKEFHPGTKPSIDFIYDILEDAYNRGMKYDVSNMYNKVYTFAVNSTHQSDYCIKKVMQMKWRSDDCPEPVDAEFTEMIFYDVEVFPNLFVVCWKARGKTTVKMINPTPEQIEELTRYRLVGFNCRRYDNHILYARLMGYTNEQLYNLSQSIISGDSNVFFGEAYNLSYTDIYDFASSGNKKSLKKLEIEMGIHHQELGLPWDKPVPENLWEKVADYCVNDVVATEAAFDYLKADFTARQILADIAGGTVNDTTNSLTTKIIFGRNKNPQSEFCYRNLAEPVKSLPEDVLIFLKDKFPKMMKTPHGDENSLLPYFPGYEYKFGKSTYMGEEVGEGGYVYAEPGIYYNVALLDIASMHPHSDLAECLFGPRFTKAFYDIVYGRVHIKHEAWDDVNKMLDGKFKPYVEKVIAGEMTSKDLANALKTAINSVYGLTAAKFDNPFRDKRNVDNIVAKRGALFMINLKHEVQKRGFTVAHIKTDSIKIPNATPEIIHFVMDYGARYGYSFEHEATYKKMCLVNDAVYIAQYADGDKEHKFKLSTGEEIITDWTATGKQFAVPYVFKTLFSKSPIIFEDLCETFSVSKGDLYLDRNEGLPDVSDLEKKIEKIKKELNKVKANNSNPSSMGAVPTNVIYDLESQIAELQAEIDKGHNLIFVGRVGQFCPIQSGKGGGVLYRVADGKNYAAAGTTGYRWLESEMVKTLEKENNIDKSFYQHLVDEAVSTISKYGDIDIFCDRDSNIPP